jgi:hypothetical protein
MLRVRLFRRVVSQDKGLIEGVVTKRVVKVVELMHLFLQSRELRIEFLLLRSCTSIPKLFSA